ncbi:MAG TPA: TetR/AcrR family transcriptional regulator [Stellaceae bacterium]|nr:TetR/AcrR family transcriptional regulator [Stellaceae bacterium]
MSTVASISRKPRRTQEERSHETRRLLLAATIQALFEHGYSRATTAEIANRAGVSRGALNHHFDSKEDLVVQAVEWQLTAATAEISALAMRLKEGRLTVSDFLDELWVRFSGELFLVTIEHVAEARHNPLLHKRLVPIVHDFHAELDRIWRHFFAKSGIPARELETAFNATLCLLRGMGFQSVLRPDPAYFQRLLTYWKTHVSAMLNADPPR